MGIEPSPEYGDALLPGFSATERDVLIALRILGRATVRQLADAIPLSEGGTRGPLAKLEAAGLVTHTPTGEGPGRRRYAYELTDRAIDLFPTRYELASKAMVRFLQERYPAQLDEFWLEWASRRFEALRHYLSGSSRADVWAKLQEVLQQDDFIAQVESAPEAATGRVTVFHCPHLGLAKDAPAVCDHEQRALQEALGGGESERVAHQVDGDRFCRWEVRLDGKSPSAQ